MGRRLVACTENVIGLLDTTGQRGKPAAFSSAAAHRTPELRRARADECVNIVPVDDRFDIIIMFTLHLERLEFISSRRGLRLELKLSLLY